MIGRGGQGVLMPLSLVVVGLGLAWMIYHQLQSSVRLDLDDETVKAEVPAPPQGATEAVYRMPPLQQFDEILRRPLFSQSRRPVAAVETAGPRLVSPNLGLSLLGITIATDGKFALVIPEGGGDSLRLREGEDYQGWTLSQIEPKIIVFHREGVEERLELSYDVQPPPQPRRQRRRTNDAAERADDSGNGRKNVTNVDEERDTSD